MSSTNNNTELFSPYYIHILIIIMTLLVYSTYDIINNIVKRLGRKNHIPHTSIPNTSSKIVITSTNNNTEGNFLKTSSTKNDTEGNIRRLPPLRRDGAINNNWRAWMIIMIDTKMENIVGGIRYQMTIYSNGLRRLKIVPFVSSLCLTDIRVDIYELLRENDMQRMHPCTRVR